MSAPHPEPPEPASAGGRPRVWAEPTVKVALQLPEGLAKRLRTRAIEEGVSVSRFVGDLVVQREIEACIALGEADFEAGRTHSWEEFKAELDRWR
jgi:predicted transcriptional regulator